MQTNAQFKIIAAIAFVSFLLTTACSIWIYTVLQTTDVHPSLIILYGYIVGPIITSMTTIGSAFFTWAFLNRIKNDGN